MQIEQTLLRPPRGFLKRTFPAPLLLLVGGLLLILALSIKTDLWRWIGVALGFTVAAWSLFSILTSAAKAEVGRWQRANARRMIGHDLGAGFVTHGDGRVHYANRAAKGRFDVPDDATLSQVLRHMLANPKSLLDEVLARAALNGASAEDIVTRRGHFRLRVLWMGVDCHVWWLDDLTDGHRTGAEEPTAAREGIAAFTVAANGRILKGNPAFRALFDTQPDTLGEILGDVPLRSGEEYRLNGTITKTRRVVVRVPEKAGSAHIFLLPPGDVKRAPPQLEGGWDAIDDLPVPLLKVARDGGILASNKEARHLLNLEGYAGQRLGDVFDGPGRPIDDWLAEAVSGQGAASQFLRGRGNKQDTFVQVTLSTAGPPDDLHLIAVLNDVTELKTLEAQFVQSQKMQAIGQLAGGVAHDFNNLLTAISGHCDLLLLRHDEGDHEYSDLIQIHQNVNRAASLVGQLLAFSRKQNLHPEQIDLRDTLSDLTHLLNRLVGEKITLTLDHDPDLLPIRADKRQLEQVLMNLVVNARDAMDGAGEIRVVTENLILETDTERENVRVPKGSYVMVQVIDNGHGIAPEKLHKIFEPFWTTKRMGEGTGLGLSTAYGIVKQTGGYIFAESVVDEGTTFSLLFPSLRASMPAATKPAPVRVKPQARRADGVILLVEDEAPVRAFASRALRLRGYTVLEAACAEEALDLLTDADLSVDLFVTDVIMPGIDGPTWVRQALEQRPDTKVLFMSGYPEDAFDHAEAQIEGALFLPKPFSLDALTQAVQGLLELSEKEPSLKEPA